MKITERGEDLLAGLSATTKSALSLVPGLGQAISGYDAYKRASYDRSVRKVLELLSDRIDDLDSFFQDEYLQTEAGQQFTRKVFDAAFDAQIEDKQELFINALVNGIKNKQTTELEKLKFVDVLRHLSRASLMILAQMHNILIEQVRGPGRQPDPTSSYPLVDPSTIAENLSDRYDPYLVISSINEMESQGLFSRTGEWRKDPVSGRHIPGGGFATEMCYTDFSVRFVEFIRYEPINKSIK
jgi:hypothetical protein